MSDDESTGTSKAVDKENEISIQSEEITSSEELRLHLDWMQEIGEPLR